MSAIRDCGRSGENGHDALPVNHDFEIVDDGKAASLADSVAKLVVPRTDSPADTALTIPRIWLKSRRQIFHPESKL